MLKKFLFVLFVLLISVSMALAEDTEVNISYSNMTLSLPEDPSSCPACTQAMSQQEGLAQASSSDWDVAVRFDQADHNYFYPFGSQPGTPGQTYYATLTGSDGEAMERYIPYCYWGCGWQTCRWAVIARQPCLQLPTPCSDLNPAGCGCICYMGIKSAARLDGWYVERTRITDTRYRLVIKGHSRPDCYYGKTYVRGELMLNPASSWTVTETNSCGVQADDLSPGHATYCQVSGKSIQFAAAGDCAGCCACEDSGTINIDVIVEKTGSQSAVFTGTSYSPVYPKMKETYSVQGWVMNPSDSTLSPTIRCEESLQQGLWGYEELSSPGSEYLLHSISEGDTVPYEFPYKQSWHWLKNTEQVSLSEDENAAAITMIVKLIIQMFPENGWVGYLNDVHDGIIYLTSVGYAQPEGTFTYTFSAPGGDVANLPQTSSVTVRVPELKERALFGSFLEWSVSFVYTNIAYKVPWPYNAVFWISEVFHTGLSNYYMYMAIDPDPDYTEPVTITVVPVPELDTIPESPVKEVAVQSIATYYDGQGLVKTYLKYLGASEAGDAAWERLLLKDCYRYLSKLENDYAALDVKQSAAIEYLEENGFSLSEQDVLNTTQEVRDYGLPEMEVTIFRRMGYGDAAIGEIKDTFLLLPKELAVHYNDTEMPGAGTLRSNTAAMMASVADLLGEETPPYANFTTVTTSGFVPLTASFTDTSLRDPTSWNWGFGDGATSNEQNPVHTYLSGGNYTVSLTVSNANGEDTRTKYRYITVHPHPPAIASVNGPSYPVPVHTLIRDFQADFSDPRTDETHTAVWDWGDGSSSAGSISEQDGSGTVAGAHEYTLPGVYTITVTVTDSSGDTATHSYQFVVIYDATGGFVTGGGWITSPPGAYAADSALTGKASFGFVSKYLKGTNTPSGDTEFHFRAGELNFKSTDYEWLVIAGPRAQFKGSGSINGNGSFGFMLTATDSQQNGGGDTDRFRLKIWDTVSGMIVYDNQMGVSDDSDPSTSIEGGSIIIHKE